MAFQRRPVRRDLTLYPQYTQFTNEWTGIYWLALLVALMPFVMLDLLGRRSDK